MAPGELSALPSGEKLFVDSSILTYHLLNDPVHGKRFLKAKPEVISKIDIGKATDLFRIFSILPVSELEVEECYKAIKDHALLTNDAFHVATMKMQGITNIATNDPDFERVGGLKVWKP